MYRRPPLHPCDSWLSVSPGMLESCSDVQLRNCAIPQLAFRDPDRRKNENVSVEAIDGGGNRVMSETRNIAARRTIVTLSFPFLLRRSDVHLVKRKTINPSVHKTWYPRHKRMLFTIINVTLATLKRNISHEDARERKTFQFPYNEKH